MEKGELIPEHKSWCLDYTVIVYSIDSGYVYSEDWVDAREKDGGEINTLWSCY